MSTANRGGSHMIGRHLAYISRIAQAPVNTALMVLNSEWSGYVRVWLGGLGYHRASHTFENRLCLAYCRMPLENHLDKNLLFHIRHNHFPNWMLRYPGFRLRGFFIVFLILELGKA